jgi:hypothetical protein
MIDHAVLNRPSYIMLSGYERRSGIHVLIAVCQFLFISVCHAFQHFNFVISTSNMYVNCQKVVPSDPH